MKRWSGLVLALWVCMQPVFASGTAQLELLPNGRQEYVDPGRHIAFQLPEDFQIDTSAHGLGDPPYQVAFTSSDHKIQVRLNVEDLAGDKRANLVTSEGVSLWATTYAMNRFARRHPKDVQLSSAIPPAGTQVVWAIAGQLPGGSKYKAEKSVFVGVAPNRIFVLTMVFDDPALGQALELADVLPASVRLVP